MGRRSTGTVEARQGCIRLKFTYLNVRQVETLDLKPTPANLKAANRLLARIQGAITAGVYRRQDFFEGTSKGQPTKFGEFADEWLKTLVIAKSTLELYTSALNVSWKPFLADKFLTDIRPSDINKAVVERLKTVTPQTMNVHLVVIRKVMKAAKDDRLIEVNPAAEVKHLKAQKTEPDPFTTDEREKILAYMRDRWNEQVWNYFTFAFHTGMRPSEIIALEWGDVDWNTRQITVQRAVVSKEEKGTKTYKVRRVDLNDAALAALTRQKVHTFLVGGKIFRNPVTGTPWPSTAYQRKNYFGPALKALGIRHRDAYQTRHTYATLLLMGGVNPKYISRQLGHASLKMLFEVYGGWLEKEDAGAQAKRANEVLMGHNGGPKLEDQTG